jgi:ubiquinone/menaquinone biosynthesis C-methylase UbiE
MNYYRLFSKIYEIGAREMCLDCQGFIKEGSKILDLGCGSGIAAKYFQDFFGAKVIGVDIRDNRLVPIPFQIFDGKNLPFENNFFDIVLINYVLHHCQSPEELLKEAKRVAKRIIIFEDLPEGFFSKLRCKIHQMTFPGKKIFNFKTQKEWRKIFDKLALKIIAENQVFTKISWLDPVKRILFVLEK